MPFCPFCFRVPLIKLSIRKKGTLIVKGLLRNLDKVRKAPRLLWAVSWSIREAPGDADPIFWVEG